MSSIRRFKLLYVYMVICSDRSYYIGLTNNIEFRILIHNRGINKNSYTYSRRPVQLVYFEAFSDYTSAIRWEKQIKGWSRAKKEALIAGDWTRIRELAQCRNITHSPNFEKRTDNSLSA